MEAGFTYPCLFLPHAYVLALGLGEMVPNLLVTGCREYSLDLTDLDGNTSTVHFGISLSQVVWALPQLGFHLIQMAKDFLKSNVL